MLEFFPVNERVASARLQVAGGKVPSVAVPYAPNSSVDHPALLEWG